MIELSQRIFAQNSFFDLEKTDFIQDQTISSTFQYVDRKRILKWSFLNVSLRLNENIILASFGKCVFITWLSLRALVVQ